MIVFFLFFLLFSLSYFEVLENRRIRICTPMFLVTCNFVIEYEIIGEGSQILTNQKRESTVFSLLIGRNLRPFPDNFVLYWHINSILSLFKQFSCLYESQKEILPFDQ